MYEILLSVIGFVPNDFLWIYPVFLIVFVCLILGILFKLIGASL